MPDPVTADTVPTQSLTVGDQRMLQRITALKDALKNYNELVSNPPLHYPAYVQAATTLVVASNQVFSGEYRQKSALAGYVAEVRGRLFENIQHTLEQPSTHAPSFLTAIVGRNSPLGKQNPELCHKLLMGVGSLPTISPAAKNELSSYLSNEMHGAILGQQVQALDSRQPFNAQTAAQLTVDAIKGGALNASGEFLASLARRTNQRSSDQIASIGHPQMQEWVGLVLESGAFSQAVQTSNSPEALQQMKTLIALCDEPTIKNRALNQFAQAAEFLTQSGLASNETKRMAERLYLEVVGLRPKVSPNEVQDRINNVNFALDHGHSDLVQRYVLDLARTGDRTALALAGAIVQSDDFKKVVDPLESAEAVVLIAEAQLVQPEPFNVGQGQITTEELLKAGVSLSTVPRDPQDATDEIQVGMRVVDLLAKRIPSGDPLATQATTKLLQQLMQQQRRIYDAVPELQDQSSTRRTIEAGTMMMDVQDDVDEPYVARLSKAEELQQLAQLARSCEVYGITPDISTIQGMESDAANQFDAALRTHSWQEVVGIAEVTDTLFDGEEARTRRAKMIEATIGKAGQLWNDAQKTDLANPSNHQFMDALDCALELASHDRALCEIPLKAAQQLQTEVQLKQLQLLGDVSTELQKHIAITDGMKQNAEFRKNSLATKGLTQSQIEIAHKEIEIDIMLEARPHFRTDPTLGSLGIQYASLRDLGAEVDDAVEKAQLIASELQQIPTHSIKDRSREQLRDDVRRFQGELKTGLQYSRAFTYSSLGMMSSSDQEIVSDFGKQASFAVSQATMELMSNDISQWKLGSTRINNHIKRQENWARTADLLKDGHSHDADDLKTARKALANDMRLLAKYQSKRPSDGKLQSDSHKLALVKLLDDNGGDLEAAIKARATQLKASPIDQDSRKAATSFTRTFAAEAGYLVEERTYQLLQDQKRTGWDPQNTKVIPPDPNTNKETRPDLMQRLGGDKWVALDFTASESGGHIFGKANAWNVGSVTQVVEITYPSFQPAELERFMLEQSRIDPQALEKAQREAADLKQRIEETISESTRTAKQLYGQLRDCYPGGKGKFDKAVETKGMEIETFAKWADLNGVKKYGRGSKKGKMTLGPQTSDEDIASLDKSVKALHALAEEVNNNKPGTVAIPEKITQMAKDGIKAYRVPLPLKTDSLGIQPHLSVQSFVKLGPNTHSSNTVSTGFRT